MSSLPQAGSPSDTEPLPRPEGGSRHFEQGSKAGPLLMQAYYRPSMTSKDAVLLDIIWSVPFTIPALCLNHIVLGWSLHSGCCVCANSGNAVVLKTFCWLVSDIACCCILLVSPIACCCILLTAMQHMSSICLSGKVIACIIHGHQSSAW